MHGGEKKLLGFGDNWSFVEKPSEYCRNQGRGCQHTDGPHGGDHTVLPCCSSPEYCL